MQTSRLPERITDAFGRLIHFAANAPLGITIIFDDLAFRRKVSVKLETTACREDILHAI